MLSSEPCETLMTSAQVRQTMMLMKKLQKRKTTQKKLGKEVCQMPSLQNARIPRARRSKNDLTSLTQILPSFLLYTLHNHERIINRLS